MACTMVWWQLWLQLTNVWLLLLSALNSKYFQQGKAATNRRSSVQLPCKTGACAVSVRVLVAQKTVFNHH